MRKTLRRLASLLLLSSMAFALPACPWRHDATIAATITMTTTTTTIITTIIAER